MNEEIVLAWASETKNSVVLSTWTTVLFITIPIVFILAVVFIISVRRAYQYPKKSDYIYTQHVNQ
jgi:hypothetical protein